MRPHDLGQLVAPGVLERADRDHLVVLAPHVAEVGVDHLERLAQPAAGDLVAHHRHLLGGGVDAGHAHAAALVGAEHEAAEAAADVDHLLAGGEPQLGADVIDLVLLRLFQRARAFLPVGAGVHHQRVVEPEAVELGAERVVKARVGLGLLPGRVRVAQLVPAVAQRDRPVRPGHVAEHAGGERLAKAAFQHELAVEIGLEQADVPKKRDAALGGRGLQFERERRLARAAAQLAAVGEARGEGGAGHVGKLPQRRFEERSHVDLSDTAVRRKMAKRDRILLCRVWCRGRDSNPHSVATART